MAFNINRPKIRDADAVYATLLKYVRKELRLDQHALARKLKLNQSTISRVERGQLSLQHKSLRQLEKITGKSIDQLIFQAMGANPSIEAAARAEQQTDKTWTTLDYNELSILRFRLHKKAARLQKRADSAEQSLGTAKMQRQIRHCAIAVFEKKLKHYRAVLDELKPNAPAALIAGQEQQIAKIQKKLRPYLVEDSCHTLLEIAEIELKLEALKSALEHCNTQLNLLTLEMDLRKNPKPKNS